MIKEQIAEKINLVSETNGHRAIKKVLPKDRIVTYKKPTEG